MTRSFVRRLAPAISLASLGLFFLAAPDLIGGQWPETAPVACLLFAASIVTAIWKIVRARKHRPSPPWLARQDWAERRVVAREDAYWKMILAGLAIGSLGAPGLWATIYRPREFEGPGARIGAAAFCTLIVLLGGYMVFVQMRDLFLGRRRITSECHLQTLPGIVGGWFKAEARIPRLPDMREVRVRLSNLRLVRIGKETRHRTYWSDNLCFDAPALPLSADGRLCVPVRFRIPADTHPATLEDRSNRVLWRLEVEAEIPGSDLAARFEVPVFSGPAPDPSEQRDEPLSALTPSDAARQQSQAPPGVSSGFGPDGALELAYDGRSPGRGLIALAMVVMFGAFAWQLIGEKADLERYFGYALTGFAALAGLGTLAAFFHRWRVSADPEGLRIRHNLPGLGLERVARADLQNLKVAFRAPGSRVSNPGRTFVVVAHYTRRGKPDSVGLSPSFKNREEAEWILQRLEEALGLAET